MVADLLSRSGASVVLFEKNPALARKLLIAGSSGLNVTHSTSEETFHERYMGAPNAKFWSEILRAFSPKDWLQFLNELGQQTYLGTSGRYFLKNMKASKLVKAWIDRLEQQGVRIESDTKVTDFDSTSSGPQLRYQTREGAVGAFHGHAVCFALGGGSYENDLSWPEMFKKKGVAIETLCASNVGFEVEWASEFLKEAEGQPIKNIGLETTRGSMRGELLVTQYGLEGTPIYTLGISGPAWIDLFPDYTSEMIVEKFSKVREKLGPIRLVQRALRPQKTVQALLYHHGSLVENPMELARLLKRFPIKLNRSRPIDEAISTSGGVAWTEVDQNLMLKRYPGVYLAGEMLSWDAPTGGYLIQGCVSLAAHVARAIKNQPKRS